MLLESVCDIKNPCVKNRPSQDGVTNFTFMAFTYFVEFLTAQERDCFLSQPDTVHDGALWERETRQDQWRHTGLTLQVICTCWGRSLSTPNVGLTSGKPSTIFKHARCFVCMVLGERIHLEMWTNCGRIPHLNGDSQRRIDGQVQPGLEEPALYFHSFTLGCQVCEWIAGKPRTIPGQQSRKRGDIP